VKGISKRVSVGLLSLIFLLALVSAMPVEAKTPLRWEVTAEYTGFTTDIEWTGVILRDDGVSGIIYLDIIDIVDLTNVQHFAGIWQIDWGEGEYIVGSFKGQMVWSESEYVFNGQITETSDNWAHLNGRNVHCMGIVDYSPWPFVTNAIFQIN